MTFRNDTHRALFTKKAKQFGYENKERTAILYLLTADDKLWIATRAHFATGRLNLANVRLVGCKEITYALWNCAKDIAYGTSHITVFDLSSPSIISPTIFDLIMTALQICRYGIELKSDQTVKMK